MEQNSQDPSAVIVGQAEKQPTPRPLQILVYTPQTAHNGIPMTSEHFDTKRAESPKEKKQQQQQQQQQQQKHHEQAIPLQPVQFEFDPETFVIPEYTMTIVPHPQPKCAKLDLELSLYSQLFYEYPMAPPPPLLPLHRGGVGVGVGGGSAFFPQTLQPFNPMDLGTLPPPPAISEEEWGALISPEIPLAPPSSETLGSPAVEEFLETYLTPDTPAEDRQGWYEFLCEGGGANGDCWNKFLPATPEPQHDSLEEWPGFMECDQSAFRG